MIDLIKGFFSATSKSASMAPKDDSPHDVRIATCALLLEMAYIDGEFSETEREKILTILKENYQLPDEHIAELIRTSEEELEGSIDLWRFTSLINRNFSIEEKIRIIEMVWEISYSDGQLDKHEDYLVHKLADLLRLTHNQLIEAKLKILHSS